MAGDARREGKPRGAVRLQGTMRIGHLDKKRCRLITFSGREVRLTREQMQGAEKLYREVAGAPHR